MSPNTYSSLTLPSTRLLRIAFLDQFQSSLNSLSLLLNPLLGALLVSLQAGYRPIGVGIIWVLGLTVVAVGNARLYKRFRRAKTADRLGQLESWERRMMAGSLANGSLWGIGAAWLYVFEEPLHSTFVILTVAGMASGVAGTQTSLKHGFLGFVLPALLFPAVMIPWLAPQSHWVVALLLLIFTLFILYAGLRNGDRVRESVRLRYENRDLLERQQASERYFRSLIENAADLLATVDRAGIILFMSPSATEILGFSPSEVQGRDYFSFLHPDDDEFIRSLFYYAFDHPGEVVRGVVRWRRRSGEWLYLEGSGRTIVMPEGVYLMILNGRDITTQHRLQLDVQQAREIAEQSSQSRGQFLATMSHEMRTPLNAILGISEVLLQESPAGKTRQRLQTVHNAGKLLLDLINAVLEYTRLDTQPLELNLEPFHPQTLSNELFSLFTTQAEAKGLAWICDCSAGQDDWRLGDVMRIRQVLINLLYNAIKFTSAGSVTCHTQVLPDDQLCFSVEDTGIGIAAERQQAIFQPFTQADQEVALRYGGSGLGLTISSLILERMGSRMELTSRPGAGSRFAFCLCLPRTAGQALNNARPCAFPEDPLERLRGLRVLVVDDSEMNHLVMSAFMEEVGCTFDSARHGLEALELCAGQTYDLILMDLRMPEMDGVSALRELAAQAVRAGVGMIPAIALTAGTTPEDEGNALEAGALALLVKPVTKDALYHSMLQVLSDVRTGA